MATNSHSAKKPRVQFVWWWDRWYSLPRLVRWGGDHVFLDYSIIIGPLEIRVWRKVWKM